MNCEKIREHLSLYASGDLPEKQAAQIRDHLASCPACAVASEREEDARTAFGRLAASDTPESLPPDFSMRVQRRIVADHSHSWNPFRGRSFTRLPMFVPAAAVLGLIAILLFALSRAPRNEGQTDLAAINLNGQSLASIVALVEQHGGRITGPLPVESWKPSGEPGVYMVLHKHESDAATDSFALDYCGESDRLRSFRGSPWIRQRAGRLIARAGSRENIYIIVIVLPDSPNALRRRIERDIRNDYQPYFNYRNGV